MPISLTIKTLAAFSRTSKIVAEKWLRDSYKAGKILPCDKKYIAESTRIKYFDSFSMKQTIANGQQARKCGGILANYRVCYSIGFEPKGLDHAIKAAGGTLVEPSFSSETCDMSRLLVITKEGECGRKLQKPVRDGTTVISHRILYDVLMHQSLEPINASCKSAESKAPAALTPNAEVVQSALRPQCTTKRSVVFSSESDNSSADHKMAAANMSKMSKAEVTMLSEKVDDDFKYKQKLPKEMNLCLKKLVRLVEVDLKANQRPAAKLFANSVVEMADRGLQNECPNTSTFPSKPIFPSSRKPAEGEWENVISISLRKSPWRSISNPNIGDPNRGQLGDNGQFLVQKNNVTGSRRVVYLDSAGVHKFVACVPHKYIHREIFGNAGKESCFAWDTCNLAHSAGGTTVAGAGAEVSNDIVAFRRFHFAFTSNALLSVALYHLFYERSDLLEEFFDPKKRMYASEASVPAHAIVKEESDMDVDGPKIRRAACTPKQMKLKHGNDPTLQSQAL